MHKLLLLWLLLCTSCLAEEDPVLEFDDGDFDSRMAELDTAMVMFYAPWCAHCRKLKPEFVKAAKALAKNDPPVTLVRVDCSEPGRETCDRLEVNGFPIMRIFRNGEFSHEYGGRREAGAIIKHMKAQVGPSSKELSSLEDLGKFLEAESEVAVVGLFEKESDMKGAFLKVADKLREKVRFGHSVDDVVLQKQGIRDGIVLFRPQYLHSKFESDSVAYSGSAVTEDIEDFVTKNYHGLVGHRTLDNQDYFQKPLVVAYYAVDYVRNPKGTNYWRNRVLKIAKQYQNKVTFAVSATDDFQHELEKYGLGEVTHDKPIVLARGANDEKYIMKEQFSIEALDQFVKDLLDGKLEPHVKSEPVPERNDGPVTVAVAKNFDDVVLNNGKDTLVEFYAPWCGHCQALAPVYDQLGEKLQDEDVAIVKMDATANDVSPVFEIQGLPTIYWVAKNSKDSPVAYEGERELDDFIKFIAREATSELKAYDRNGNPRKTKTEL